MSARSFSDAKARNVTATEMLRTRDAAKARAATKAPGGNDAEYREKAAGRRDVTPHAFDRVSGPRQP